MNFDIRLRLQSTILVIRREPSHQLVKRIGGHFRGAFLVCMSYMSSSPTIPIRRSVPILYFFRCDMRIFSKFGFRGECGSTILIDKYLSASMLEQEQPGGGKKPYIK
jgi:hypothetical protein